MSQTSEPNNSYYPTIDESLGETLYHDEAALSIKLADVVEAGIRAQYRPGTAARDVHSKSTGCMRAEFRVNDSLPDALAKGIFVPGKVYQSYIRFSNGAPNPGQSDDNEDGRGMAIKLLNVPGEKILEGEEDATTQDFVMINHPVFFTNDPHSYLALIEKAGSTNPFVKLSIPLSLGLKGTVLIKALSTGKISNPLQIRYFSASPYQLGIGLDRQVIKFSVRPSSPVVDPIPSRPGHDYLRKAMKATLQQGEVTLIFSVQVRTLESLRVEDCTTAWDEVDAPFRDVATIHIPQQDFDTPELNELGENLSFNPWHSLPEHRPLGSVNRMRRVVYERISRVRREINSVDWKEP